MFIYLVTFIITLACIFLALEIVILTKKTLGKSYKLISLAAIIFALIILLKILSELGYVQDIENFNFLYLIFIVLFFDGLLFMKRLIRGIEEKKIQDKK